MGSSVLQAHKTWSQSFLLKDFCICIDKSFIRREYSDRPGRKYRGGFVWESSSFEEEITIPSLLKKNKIIIIKK